MKKLSVALFLSIAVVLVLTKSAQAVLEVRGLGTIVNGGSSQYQLIYDTELDITWLDFTTNSYGNWFEMTTWVEGLEVAFSGQTFDDWRLPSMDESVVQLGMVFGYQGPDQNGNYGYDFGYNMVIPEMGHLWYETLGNKGYFAPDGDGVWPQSGWGLENTGPFQNLLATTYWSGTDYTPFPASAWAFNAEVGKQLFNHKNNNGYALAVRDGDVGPPPPTNLPPVLDPIGNKTSLEGQLLEFTITATDLDLGDTLTFSASNLPPGAIFNPVTATFTWTPTYDQEGNYENVVFSVQDNGNPVEVDAEAITITIGNINRPPQFNDIGSLTVPENELLEFLVNCTDPDENNIVLSCVELPPGASFNATAGLFSWTPDYWMAGNYVVAFSATDDGDPNLTSYLYVSINVGEVVAPGEMTEEIIEIVTSEQLNLPEEVVNSYVANVKKVPIFIEKNKLIPAINQIDAFIDKIDKDIRNGKIDAEVGNDLIDRAIEVKQQITP